MARRPDSRACLSHLFRGLDAGLVESLTRAAYTLGRREGEHLWHARQAAETFTVIQRGLVQIERTVAGKEPATLGIFSPGESVGMRPRSRAAPTQLTR